MTREMAARMKPKSPSRNSPRCWVFARATARRTMRRRGLFAGSDRTARPGRVKSKPIALADVVWCSATPTGALLKLEVGPALWESAPTALGKAHAKGNHILDRRLLVRRFPHPAIFAKIGSLFETAERIQVDACCSDERTSQVAFVRDKPILVDYALGLEHAVIYFRAAEVGPKGFDAPKDAQVTRCKVGVAEVDYRPFCSSAFNQSIPTLAGRSRGALDARLRAIVLVVGFLSVRTPSLANLKPRAGEIAVSQHVSRAECKYFDRSPPCFAGFDVGVLQKQDDALFADVPEVLLSSRLKCFWKHKVADRASRKVYREVAITKLPKTKSGHLQVGEIQLLWRGAQLNHSPHDHAGGFRPLIGRPGRNIRTVNESKSLKAVHIAQKRLSRGGLLGETTAIAFDNPLTDPPCGGERRDRGHKEAICLKPSQRSGDGFQERSIWRLLGVLAVAVARLCGTRLCTFRVHQPLPALVENLSRSGGAGKVQL